ncbi:MAG: HutD family protein [Marinifilaceae bacterium]|jgi:environmental stress-induced protein Ves|nr:HutD family protein [Marinifilaceae bacterium]
MKIIKYSSKDYKTAEWSGGKTTEMYIYPKGSIYSKRDFKIRISSASVEVDESIFTPLPHIDRKLMILDGCIDISHLNQYNKQLNQYEVDSFSGSWQTRSVGKCIDFNLMTQAIHSCDIEHVFIGKDKVHPSNYNNWDKIYIYVHKGEIAIEDYTGNENNLFEISNPNNIKIKALKDANIVVSYIKL